LILSKNIDISLKIDSNEQKDTEDNILSIIAATNSALITIGVSKSKLMADRQLFEELYKKNKNKFSDYLAFLQMGLNEYNNKHLFIIISEYLIEKNDLIIENLDLFDLLPLEFRNKLNKFRKDNIISEKLKEHFNIINNDLLKYFNPSNFTFKEEIFQIDNPKEIISEEDILKALQKARRDNIETISHSSNQKKKEIIQNEEKTPSLLNYFVSFPKLNQSIADKIIIDIKQLRKYVTTSPDYLDLENLFYVVNIFKMLGEELQLEPGYIKNVINNFISGKVFSTGRYHIPNPISIYYGLSILSELELLNNSEVVDLLDIEMFLENDLNPFIPDKITLNFFTILSLKMLKKSGGIITNKRHLIEPLANLNLFNSEEYQLSDMFFYLGLLKLLDARFDFTNLQAPYLTELEKKIQSNGSINGNATDTARTLLTLVLLDSTGKDISIISELLQFLNQNLKFFIDSQDFGEFNCYQNKIAFKIELRMLFWMLLALSQYC
ncbi:MAG: hypothetical protein KGD70_09555, partial [Candidatus Lokiarchaeota archaeon]|nr:hypothetical protein [Candidatus Lokiarchaeota archaeon]